MRFTGPVLPRKRASLALALLVACSSHDSTRSSTRPQLHPPPVDASVPADAAPVGLAAVAPLADTGEVWLKGSTHVHSAPSGDSTEPTENVLAWYEHHGYSFVFLTDHNKVTEVGTSTAGQVAIRVPGTGTPGLIVFAGSELTHNPSGCLPAGDETKRCRIHVNALGPTERPKGKIEWAQRHSKQRVDLYQAAIDEAHKVHAALVQINHPNYYWGMTADVLIELQKRGAQLVEIANAQFEKKWNPGDATHPSTEALWDAVLATGATMWGVASDDAHDYDPDGGGKYPAGGAWIVVHARREPQAILDAIAGGRFYASNGVTLARAEVDGEELVVEVAPGDGHARYTIAFIENGTRVATSSGLTARRLLPRTGYVRAVITRDDGKKAWVQPARR